MSSTVSKIVAQRNHRILLELVLEPGNGIHPYGLQYKSNTILSTLLQTSVRTVKHVRQDGRLGIWAYLSGAYTRLLHGSTH